MYLVVSLQPALRRVQFLGAAGSDGDEVLAAHFEADGHGATAARLLRTLGEPVDLLGLGGGPLVTIFRESLAAEEIGAWLVETASPLPLAVCHHRWEESGSLATRVYPEPAARVSGAELRSLLAEAEERLDRVEGVLVCGGNASPGVDFAVWQLLRHVRAARVRAVIEAHGRVLVEAAEAGPPHVVTGRDALAAAAAERGVDAEDFCSRLLAAGTETIIVTSGPDPVEVIQSGERVRIQPPSAADRGGSHAREALAAGYLHALDRGWEVVPAVSWGIAAGTARIQKEIGGKLDRSEIEGFFAQVRTVREE